MARLSIPKELVKSGLLRINLHAVRAVMQRELGLKHFPISMDDKVKAQQENDGSTTYPYGWMVPTDAQIVRDQINTTASRRIGQRVGTYGATRNTSRVGHIFPIKIGLEIHIVGDDADKMLHLAETLLLLSAFQNALSFDVKYGDQFSLNTRLEIPDSVTVPFADTGDTTKPGALELSMQLIAHTYAGFFYDKASVYAHAPIIGTAIRDDDDVVVGFKDLPDSLLPAEYSTNEPST